MALKLPQKIALILLLAALLSAVTGCLFDSGQAQSEERPAPSPERRSFKSRTGGVHEQPGGPESQVNILLLGLDARGVSDAIVLLTYNAETYETAIISIKRDTYIDFQTWSEEGMGHSALGWASYAGMGYGGEDKVGGVRYTARTIEELLDIPIDSYAGISFDGFVELIDEIGGVEVDLAPGFSAHRHLNPGRQRLYGEEALRYARHRKNPRIPEPGSTTSDGDRIRRNQRLLQAVYEQCRTLSTEELLDIYDSLNQKLYTNMDDWDLMLLANIFFHQDLRLVEQLVLPGEHEKVYESGLDEEFVYYFLDFAACDEIFKDLGMK